MEVSYLKGENKTFTDDVVYVNAIEKIYKICMYKRLTEIFSTHNLDELNRCYNYE